MTDTLNDKDMLKWIVFYCDAIENALMAFDDDYDRFDIQEHRTVFDACAFYVGQIGEHVNKLTKEFKAVHTNVPWRQIIGLRNRIFHDYASVKKKSLWTIMRKEVPELNARCRSLRAELEEEAIIYDQGDQHEQ
ncbi:MAG: DUF86 domain-containing protein [Selenomonadaceae bacterium]|nr:DUF86 domain-containing protein [Selenomonadaceae bacterium]